ncbi:MAG: hypothetical protein ACI81P_003366 [Neolewinella sp.]|jgi:hypothetical protein
MAQQFIVEGNDAYVLTALGTKQGLGYPSGYNKQSFKNFVVKAGSITKIPEAIRTALQDEDVTNIGVVVDANEVGVQSRIDSISASIRQVSPGVDFNIELSPQGWITELKDGLTFGLWVMPDNASPGYLEHFLARLIPNDDTDLALAEELLRLTKAAGNPKFPATRDQKAILSLFLAIQRQPGMSPQTAISNGLLDHQNLLSQNFLTWFTGTFRF